MPNRMLSAEELKSLFGPFLEEVRGKLKALSSQTSSYENDFKEGLTANGGISLGPFKATLKTDDSWTWTDINTTAASTGSEQK